MAVNTSNENILYFTEPSNNCIRRCDMTNKTGTLITTFFFGALGNPVGLIFSSDLKYLYCSSFNYHQIFKFHPLKLVIG